MPENCPEGSFGTKLQKLGYNIPMTTTSTYLGFVQNKTCIDCNLIFFKVETRMQILKGYIISPQDSTNF